MGFSMRHIFLPACLALSSLAYGQVPETTANEALPRPGAIDAQDIPLEAERVISDLEFSQENLKADTIQASLTKRLQALSEQSGVILENPAAAKPDELGSRARDWYRFQWTQLLSRREALTRELDQEVSRLQAERTKLRAQEEIWRATEKAYSAAELAPALRDRIRTVLALTNQVDQAYALRLNNLSRLYHEVQSGDRTVRETLARFDEAEQTAMARMLSVDSPPIWRLFGPYSQPDAAPPGKARGMSLSLASLAAFFDHYRAIWISHAVLAALMLGITLSLARRRKQWKEKAFLAQAVNLLSAPISLAMLLTLLLTAGIFFTLPLRVLDVRSLLMSLLTVRVLHRVLKGRIRQMLYMAIGLFIAAKLTDFAPDFSVVERLGLLSVNLAAMAFMNYVGRALPVGEGRDRWWAWARLLAIAVQPLLAVGLIANILGNVTLAQTITNGSVFSMASGVVLACGVLILETIITAVTHLEALPRFKALHKHRELIASRLFRAIRFVALATWVSYTLYFFRILEWMKTNVVDVVTYRIQIGSLDLSALDVIAFVASLYLATLISRFVRFILEEEVYERIRLPRGLPNTVSMLTNYGILAIGFFVAIQVAGIDMSRFAIIAGALGVGIGFGLQNVVNNFVSGLILAFERPIQVGDTIEVGPLTGHVMRIGFRSSTVRTYDGAEVIVPNGNLISAEVVNWTLSDRTRRLTIPVGVAYGSDPQKVLEVLGKAVDSTEGILEYPQPSIIFQGFGDSSLNFSVRVWIRDFEEIFRISSSLSLAIYAALNEAGLEIPFPQRDLHLKSVSPGIGVSGAAPATETAG
jgi:potassium efflux system protein